MGATGLIEQDCTEILQAAIDGMPEFGVLELPPGVYRATDTVHIQRSNVTIRGNGATFYNDDPGTLFPQGMGASYPAIVVGHAVPTHSVLIEGINFQGRHDPFTGINNLVTLSSSCIVFTYASHCEVRGCSFRNMWGHTVRSGFPGTQHRINIRNCASYYCSNGYNVNADDSEYTDNYGLWCNGIESHGDRNVYTGNVLVDSSGISLGGKGGPSSTVDVVCSRNKIIRCWKGGAIAMGGCANALLEDNIITDASYHEPGYPGIQTQASTALNVPGWIDGPSRNNTFRRNRVTLAAGRGGSHCLWIQAGENSVLEDNILGDGIAIFGLYVQDTGCRLRRNVVDGTSSDIHLEGASGPITVYMSGNTGNVTQGAGVTIVNE